MSLFVFRVDFRSKMKKKEERKKGEKKEFTVEWISEKSPSRSWEVDEEIRPSFLEFAELPGDVCAVISGRGCL